ncbi:hypothetical protein H247_1918 [Klebsiella pneumoniae VAKPC278]|uniref:Uncharacterized protein n=2 Tax=Klebsiella pneumoniae TaxID=573 RepID=W8UDG8_KLEPN|nr:hypothetical protein KPNJ2_00305 [Klebsiella pneumoniae 30684/NJST258_2]AHM82709.1 hypothetical protein KPNJ1_00303 [Klebsiella pneumoniae 30660/NJST258_1]AVJ84097.1 putative dUTP diphosphatase [Klebsiella pneumoniae]EPB22799.1 hypothetical protein H247_1918 [Klebsiella pneumoniae VAKPC278]CDL08640.1 hypothetical protein [Klebsiella pneumoniae IS43]
MVYHSDITFFPAVKTAGVKRKVLCLKTPPFLPSSPAGNVRLSLQNL